MSNVKKLMMQAASGKSLNVEEVFSTHLHTGNSGTLTVNNAIDLAGEGGLVWIKSREGFDHVLTDSTSSGAKYLSTAATTQHQDFYVGGGSDERFTFSSTGFSSTAADFKWNNNDRDYVSWTFRKAPNFFDIVTYTGDGSQGRAISHNLGSVPGMVLIKRTDAAGNWPYWHSGIPTKFLNMNSTQGNSDGQYRFGDYSNPINPTATTFTVSNYTDVNANNGTYVAYIFAHHNNSGTFGASGDKDIIKCGTYAGNGSVYGTAVNLGFEPQFVFIKAYTHSQAGVMFDSMRGISSAEDDQVLYPSATSAEGSPQAFLALRPDGFQLQTDNYEANGSGVSYVYMAIRRPTAEAETGADVFKATYGNSSSNDPPGWSSPTGFVVDASLDMNFGGQGGSSTDSPTFGARLIQNKYSDQLYNTSGPTFQNWDGQNYDHQNGFADSADGGTGDLGYMWQRKAGAFDAFSFFGTGSNMTHNHNLAGEVGMAWWFTVSTSTHVYVYARPLGANKFMRLNLNYDQVTDTVLWQNTHPTNTQFYTGGGYNNSNEEHIVLLFGNLDGVSKVGTFTGNGTNQNIDCGFSNGIRLLMVKKVGTGYWYFWDEANLGSQYHDFWYIKNQAGLITNQDTIDTYSAGFNIKFNTYQSINTNGDTYLFYAVAA